jgi:hypothetical protein
MANQISNLGDLSVPILFCCFADLRVAGRLVAYGGQSPPIVFTGCLGPWMIHLFVTTLVSSRRTRAYAPSVQARAGARSNSSVTTSRPALDDGAYAPSSICASAYSICLTRIGLGSPAPSPRDWLVCDPVHGVVLRSSLMS